MRFAYRDCLQGPQQSPISFARLSFHTGQHPGLRDLSESPNFSQHVILFKINDLQTASSVCVWVGGGGGGLVAKSPHHVSSLVHTIHKNELSFVTYIPIGNSWERNCSDMSPGGPLFGQNFPFNFRPKPTFPNVSFRPVLIKCKIIVGYSFGKSI